MEIKRLLNGNISLRDTLGTLEIGEEWLIKPDAVNVRHLRTTASFYGAAVDKYFKVSAPTGAKAIKVTRFK